MFVLIANDKKLFLYVGRMPIMFISPWPRLLHQSTNDFNISRVGDELEDSLGFNSKGDARDGLQSSAFFVLPENGFV